MADIKRIVEYMDDYLTQSGRKAASISGKPSAKTTLPETSGAAVPANRKSSFPPLSDSETRILILGTLPGDRSLEVGEYYGHPRNRFWRVVSTITASELPATWPDKRALLLRSKIGLWDVAHRASREGSLDSAIKNEEPNDIPAFISAHNNLKVIGFNGQKAEALYDRYFDRQAGIRYVSLPGTSPANARATLEGLCERWRGILA